ncbi:MAG: 3-dehydroquinate synthase [Gammaproteobacteria bacterium]|nr:3-dehydroquinate synthase [Gammaproteobacteria bacterium]
MKMVDVSLAERSYSIIIGSDLLGKGASYSVADLGKSRLLIVTNSTVAPLYLEKLQQGLEGYSHDTLILPDGEQYKNGETLNLIYDALLQKRFDRGSTLVALGGGVIGDITGYAAATYQRGIDFIQVPTTLLAQVDSSVGGKTGINHPLGKNMIGAFHQPKLVIADTATLNSLDDRQLRAGLAEVIKYGLIDDLPFFGWLESALPQLLQRDMTALAYAVEVSCKDKAAVVAADEREAGKRALLNLGHTFGHAIETAMGYGNWLHGEAVATGMVLAAAYSHHLGLLPQSDLQKITAMMVAAGLATQPPAELTADQFMAHMAVDKKVKAGRLRLVLLKGIGHAFVAEAVDEADLRRWLGGYLAV